MPKYPGRNDPLDLLRKAYNKKSERHVQIKNKGSDLFFDKQIRFNLKTETAWQSTQTHKQYNLGSLWLFMESHVGTIQNKSQYIGKVTELDVEMVNAADQKQIIQYFTGEVDETPCIRNQLKMALSQKGKRSEPSGGFENVEEEPTKKAKPDHQQLSHELQIMDFLFNFQRPVNSKSKCLRFPSKDFYGILRNLFQNQNKAVEQSKDVKKTKTLPRIAKFYELKKLPIIIVPGSQHVGNICIHNVEKFLLASEYDENAKLENQMATKVQIEKELRGKKIMFEANSRPNLLSQKDWEYVVAIFVQGRDNEFEGWPVSDHRKIFQSKRGFFMRLPGPLSSSCREWRVKSFIVDRNKRYNDHQIVKAIWEEIEEYIFERV